MTNVPETASHAFALHELAEAMRELPDMLDTLIVFQPGWSVRAAADNRQRVDNLAQALFGKPGVDECSGSMWTRHAEGKVGPLRVSITAYVPSPPDPRDAEIERLRAALANSAAGNVKDLGDFTQYAPEGRTTAVAEAKPDTFGQALGHHGAIRLPGEPETLVRDVEKAHAEALDDNEFWFPKPTCRFVLARTGAVEHFCGEPIAQADLTEGRVWVHDGPSQSHNAVGPAQT
jgi:hypothetical protein